MTELYGKFDPRDIPTYSISDAARYLRIPPGTIRSWTIGRKYPVSNGLKNFNPIIAITNLKPILLSFTNLIEIHVLRAIRKHHKIDLGKVRTALDFIDEQFAIPHPLANERFHTNGVDLFIEKYGSLINASESGQTELKDAFNAHLQRIELDDTGLAIKLYPFTRSDEEDNPRLVALDPRIAFGRLVIVGTGIATSVLAERYHAGESIDDLAYDYECDRFKIEEAIRCELPFAA
ncbi:DUF433 domain-containing protein [Cronbergia sp. UHCC 0137]|uniref:DUF433 domain-containing protein n=1 Tax=Cronbergia sp. UHCC 0137 TaxID=3110239 RepID=UPI002B20AAFC|nr:DUF433 domain-containing protein [Cronbergia sp. UHCC 0137]MEA5619685.1 DUF433 domain-containing protein [Cronbergia sp. UHCC 0137]